MLRRIACARCRLGSLWTDEPAGFLATVCCRPGRCEAVLLDEEFAAGTGSPAAADAPGSGAEAVHPMP